jgi:hypothetical protein
MRRLLLLVLLLAPAAAATAQTYYQVKFPDDRTVYGCGATADTIWPEIVQYSNCSFYVGVSVKDQVFYNNEAGSCYKILRRWRLFDWCYYNPNIAPYYVLNPPQTDVGPTVYGTAANNGYLEYFQIIKVRDTVPPVFLNCPAGPVLFCDYTGNDPNQYHQGSIDRCEGGVQLQVAVNDLCSGTDVNLSYRLFLDLDQNGTMETFVTSSDPAAWPIAQSVAGGVRTASIQFPTGFGLPYAKHKVEWIANDNCGNERTCKYEFEVKDCKAPTIVCHNGLSINIMQTGMITLWDTDFLQYATDNCTPAALVKIGIRKAGAGTGFPADNHSVTFTCAETGIQAVEVWAQDAYGNADFCLTYVNVQDNMGSCPPVALSAAVTTDQDQPVPGVQLQLTTAAAGPGAPPQLVVTDTSGQYQLPALAQGCGYTLTPWLDTLPLLGVNTLDIIYTSAYLQGSWPMPTPYRLLATDVDRSGQVTSGDLHHIMHLLLGQTSAFPNNAAWRFVPAAFTFPDSISPLAAAAPEALTFCLPAAGLDPGFVAIKIGDVNGSLVPPVAGGNSRPGAEHLPARFRAAERTFQAGETVVVPIGTPDLADLAGFQFTLGFDPGELRLERVEPGLVPAAWTGIFPEKGRVTASWHTPSAISRSDDGNSGPRVAFNLVFTARKAGRLSAALRLQPEPTPGEAYNRRLETGALQLEIGDGPAAPTLLSVRPNPVRDRVTVGFRTAAEGPVELRFSDLTGRTVHTTSLYCLKGENEATVDLASTGVSGLLFLRLESAGGTAVQRVMVGL